MSTLTQQLYSQSHWLADGTQTIWNFSFSGGYISREHVRAYTRGPLETDPRVDLVIAPEDFIGDFQISIVPAVTSGHTLIIYRDTPKDLPLVDFADGANINEVSLDTVARQAVFIAAESADFLGVTTTADLAALAATAIANAGAAAASAANALSSENTAGTQAGNAALSATNSATSATSSANSAANAAASASAAAGAVAALEAELAAVTAGNGASKIGVQDAGGYFTATNQEGVDQEIGQSLATLTTNVAALAAIDNDLLQQVSTSLSAGTAQTIACFGDSTMWGADPANLANQVAIPSPAQLQNLVNSFFANSALTVTNNALGGSTCTQMIAGTDGSGSTFATKMAASSAVVVFCNHGVNDAFGASATTLAQYKTALLAFIATCRLYSKVPVLVTPYPCLTIGTFGSHDRAAATARFAAAMRDIASKHGVFVVDNHYYLSLLLGMDGTQSLPLTVLPDGVHGAALTYTRAGNNLAEAVIGAQAGVLDAPNQRVTGNGPLTQATSQSFGTDTASRVGVVVTSGTTSPQTMRVAFKVCATGLDVYMAHPIWSNGSATVTVNLDGISSATLPMLMAGYTTTFCQDHETLVARSIPPGFHVILMTTASVGAVGFHYLRTRAAEKRLLLPSANAVPSEYKLLASKLESTSASADTPFVCEDIPMSRWLDGYEFEFTGVLENNSGVIIGGNIGSTAGSAAVEKFVIFGLGGAGLLSVSEASAPATYLTTAIGAVNLAGVSHVYRVAVTAAGVASLYVDGTLIGTHNLVQPYYGGYLGLWKNSAGGVLTVTNVCRVWRL